MGPCFQNVQTSFREDRHHAGFAISPDHDLFDVDEKWFLGSLGVEQSIFDTTDQYNPHYEKGWRVFSFGYRDLLNNGVIIFRSASPDEIVNDLERIFRWLSK